MDHAGDGNPVVAPAMRRITFEAPEFTVFRPAGLDEYFGLIVPPPGRPLRMPDPATLNVRRAVTALPEAERPALPWYTIARHRPGAAQIDVDFVRHEHAGPAGAWAETAQVGDVAGFRTGTGSLALPTPGQAHLVLGDETALPTLTALLAAAAAAQELGRLEVVVEVPRREDFPVPASVPGVAVSVLERGGREPGAVLVPFVEQLDPVPRTYAWACGEQSLAARVRRALVARGMAGRRDIMFSGYWRRGGPRL